MNDDRAHAAWEMAHNPWAVREELLPSIAAMLRGSSPPALAEQAEGDQEARSAGAPQLHAGVAVISLRGLITPGTTLLSLLLGGGLQRFRSELREAAASDEVASILIDVNSPGGYIDLVPETAAEIRAARDSKPVVAIANTNAASAAYWLASQASEVVVTLSGAVGSIGVFSIHEDWSKFDERVGIKTTLISAGKYKTEASPYEPLSEEAEAAIQERVDDRYAAFLADVGKGRGVAASKVRSDFGEGRMVLAKDAVKAGMADRVDTFEGALTKLARGRGSGRKGLQLRGHIDSVKAEVEEVTTRVADAVAQRAENGQTLAEATLESAAELEAGIQRLREALAIEPRNDNAAVTDAQRERLRHLARENEGAMR